MTTTIYTLEKGKDTLGMAQAAKNFLREEEHMEVQLLELTNGEYVVQGRVKGGNFRQVVGMDKVAMVKFTPIGTENVAMEIGKGKWMDKGVVMTVSMFVLWPLAVTSGVGMYKQGKLPGKIQKAVKNYLSKVEVNV